MDSSRLANTLRQMHRAILILKDYNEDAGGCDHSVGICCCAENRLIEDCAITLIQAEKDRLYERQDLGSLEGFISHEPYLAEPPDYEP